jgi:hypothetical protein
MANPNIKPRWKKGESGNPAGRPKGALNKKTEFEEALRYLAKVLKLKESPDEIKVKIIAVGIKKALQGEYSFWKDIMDRIFGKPTSSIDIRLKEEKLAELEEMIRNWVEEDRDNEQ